MLRLYCLRNIKFVIPVKTGIQWFTGAAMLIALDPCFRRDDVVEHVGWDLSHLHDKAAWGKPHPTLLGVCLAGVARIACHPGGEAGGGKGATSCACGTGIASNPGYPFPVITWDMAIFQSKLPSGEQKQDHMLSMWIVIDAIAHDDPERLISSPEVSLESHLIAFAAERARRQNTVEDICL